MLYHTMHICFNSIKYLKQRKDCPLSGIEQFINYTFRCSWWGMMNMILHSLSMGMNMRLYIYMYSKSIIRNYPTLNYYLQVILMMLPWKYSIYHEDMGAGMRADVAYIKSGKSDVSDINFDFSVLNAISALISAPISSWQMMYFQWCYWLYSLCRH